MQVYKINDIISPQKVLISAKESNIYIDGIECAKITNKTAVTLSQGKSISLAFLNKQHFIRRRIELSHRLRHE